MFVEYRGVVDETQNLKVYNDYVATLVADQQRSIDSLQTQIDGIDGVKRGMCHHAGEQVAGPFIEQIQHAGKKKQWEEGGDIEVDE